MPGKTKKALVLRLSSLGDVVMATAALAPLRAAGFEVSFATKAAFSAVLQHHPDIEEVYAFDSSKGEAFGRADFLRWAQAKNFELVVDLQDSWRTFFWRRHLRKFAQVKVARKERLREWMILFLRLGRFFSFGRGGRALKFRRAAVDALAARREFAPSGGGLTKLAVTEAEKAQARRLVPEGDFAVFLPGSAWKGKEWPYFSQLAALVSRKIPVVALGSEKDERCDEIAREAAPHSRSVSLRGQTTLRQSMAVISLARWVIGNDTGMVHVAEALGRDAAMIEGPTHKFMGFSPYREKSLLVGLDLLCRPCSKSGRICPRLGSRKCLRGLSVPAVAEKLRRWGLPC